MDAHGIEVLDRADDDAVALDVDDDLQLELLPALERLLDEHLSDRARRQAVRHALTELCRRPSDAAAASSERERRSHDRRHRTSLDPLERGRDDAQRGRAGLRIPSRPGRASGPRPVRIALTSAPISSTPCSASTPFSASSTARLSAVWPPSVGRSASGASRANDLRERQRVQRLEVGRVGPLGVGHDRGRVRVHEHDAVALAAQRPARLHAGVVELAALSDPDRPGADDQDAA